MNQTEQARQAGSEPANRGSPHPGSTSPQRNPFATLTLMVLFSEAPQAEEMLPDKADMLAEATGVFSTTLGALANIVIILFVGLFLAIEPRLYADGLLRLVPVSKRTRAREVLYAMGGALQWWLVGKVFAMLVVGVLTALGVVLGTFIATFLYSLPIQAANVIAVVSDELAHAIERLFPEKLGHGVPGDGLRRETEIPEGFAYAAHAIVAADSGYLQAIDTEKLMAVAKAHDLLLDVQYRPGHFVEQGSTCALAWPGERVDKQVTEQLSAAFICGPERTLAQDVGFAVNQLVEVAVRALSPGTNDPFTAIRCIDRLGAALCQLTERVMPSPYRYDDTDTLRVIAPPVTFAGVVDAAFNQIRQYGRTSVAVTIRLLERIAAVAARTYREEDRAALLRHAVMIEHGSHEGIPQEQDRQDVQERFQAVVRALEQRRAKESVHV